MLQYLSEESENLFPKHWPLVLSKILPKESEPPPRLWSTIGLSSPSLSTSAGPPPTSGTSAWPLQVRLTSTTARRHHCHPAACQAVPGVHNQDKSKSTTSAKAQPTSAKAQDQCKTGDTCYNPSGLKMQATFWNDKKCVLRPFAGFICWAALKLGCKICRFFFIFLCC